MTIPKLTDAQMIALGSAVLDLLREINDHTLVCLREHGLERHAADLNAATDPVLDALDPFITAGDAELWDALGIHVDEDEE